MSHRSKRTKVTSSSGEGGAGDAETSSGSAVSSFIQNFTHPSHAAKFNAKWAKRKVMPGRIIDFDYLRSIDFPYIANFENLGWTRYLQLKRPYYENLVRIFYFNATQKYAESETSRAVHHDDSFVTHVMGQRIVVTRELIERVFHLTSMQSDLCRVSGGGNLVSAFIRPPSRQSESPNWTRMSFFDQVLHLIIAHTIRPRQAMYVNIRTEGLWFLNNIKLSRRIDLAKFIMDDMLLTIDGLNRNLHYGMLISEIIDYFNVDSRCDPPINHALFDHINEHSIKQLGFEFRNNTWVRNEPVDVDPAFARLLSFMETMDARLNARLELLEGQNRELMQRQQQLEDLVRSQFAPPS